MRAEATQPHRVYEELIEIRAGEVELTRALQQRASALHRRELATIIDRVCCELGPGDRVHRIQTLEVELGEIEFDELGEFEREFCRRLEPALRRALRHAIDQLEAAAGPEREPLSRVGGLLELVEIFAWTGNLPWWADGRARDLVTRSLRELVETEGSSAALKRLVVSLGERREVLARVVAAADAATLEALVERVLGGPGGLRLSKLAARLLDSPRFTSASAGAGARGQVWQTALTYAVRGRVFSDPGQLTVEFVDELVGALGEAGELEDPGSAHRELLEAAGASVGDLEQALAALAVPSAALIELGEELLAFFSEGVEGSPRIEQGTSASESGGVPGDGAGRGSEGERARPASDGRAEGVGLEGTGERSRPASDGRAEGAGLGGEGALAQSPLGGAPAQLARALACELLVGALSTPRLRQRLAWLASAEAAIIPVATRARLITALNEHLARQAVQPRPRSEALTALDPGPGARAAPARRTLAELDGLAIDNAGLVILWPFLPRLFERCELLAEGEQRRAFVDARAQARAVAMLEYLASQELDAPEFVLPLNKLLCGLSPDHALVPASPLAPALLTECERMLEAVVTHAEILRDMSIADLRASFLRREGMLAVRDGAWLLRVERAAYDLVLDRFPWTWTWVRLPWMAEPLHVEW